MNAKIHGHDAKARIRPPIVGPLTVPTATNVVFTASDRPSSAGGKSARLSELTVTITADPPRPCKTRISTSTSKFGASAQPSVASANTNIPLR